MASSSYDSDVFNSITQAQKSTKDAKASLTPITKKAIQVKRSGKDILTATYVHYQVGKGKDMHINAASITDLSKISKKDLIPITSTEERKNTGGDYYLDLLKVLGPTNPTAIALGMLVLKKEPKPNHYKIVKNLYDFDIKYEQGLSMRNLFTIGYEAVNEIPTVVSSAQKGIIGTIKHGPIGGLVGTAKGVKDGFDRTKAFMIVFDGTVSIKP